MAIILGLTLSAASADAQGRSACEERIFQDDETSLCFRNDDGARLLVGNPDLQDGFLFSLNGIFECGCQLQRRADVIFVGNAGVVIARVTGNGKKLRGEIFGRDEHLEFSATRQERELCRLIPD